MSESRILRDRQEEAEAAFRRLAASGDDGSTAMLVQTKAVATYPTSASAFFACSPLRVDGPEVEGSSASFSADASRTVFAFNLGAKTPPVGTKLLVHSCGGRWTFRYDG
ncbi:hypothetical protein [Paludisphaera rhizosphaerae]|uniref:hypothetical protein n=1 Tax=Paludisphaera rhizosphaerae TaxID=2711216 RepID=UPI0013E9E4A5|nr:hypothetical protein [Paludisphaera rhizosphaerae]